MRQNDSMLKRLYETHSHTHPPTHTHEQHTNGDGCMQNKYHFHKLNDFIPSALDIHMETSWRTRLVCFRLCVHIKQMDLPIILVR